jgi:DNA-binding NtrC family response regulator
MGAPMRKVLVIDDEPIMGQTLHRMLRKQYAVTVETDSRRALELIEAGEEFDVIISDLMMSPLSGMEVYEKVHQRLPHMAARFLLMTGGACVRAVDEFLARWPYLVLLKPFSADAVAQLVNETLARIERLTAASVAR